MDLQIINLESKNWPVVREIYEQGLLTGQATFEDAAPSWEQWDAGHLPFARLLGISRGTSGDIVKGWAALSPVSARMVYAGVAEVSVYVAEAWRGQGVGRALLENLIDVSEQSGIWTLQASVFPENQNSISLHKLCGFREVGRRERIGKLHGIWRDTILLERRSDLVN